MFKAPQLLIMRASSVEKPGPSSTSEVEQKVESHGYFSDIEDTEEDADYIPPDPWRRDVREGPGYQAFVADAPSFETLFSGLTKQSFHN